MEALGLHETNFLTLTHSVTKMQLALLLDGRSVLDKLFFQNEAQKVLYKPVLISDLIIHFGWSYSLSNFRKTLKSTNQISPSVPQLYYTTKDKLRIFKASEALDALIFSFWEASGSNSHIIIPFLHSAQSTPQGPVIVWTYYGSIKS